MGIYKVTMEDNLESNLLGLLMFLVFVGAFAFAWMILSFIAMILLNVIDASYACLILDLDNAAQTRVFQRPEIAQAILVKVKPGYVVGTVSSEGVEAGAGAPPANAVTEGAPPTPTVAVPVGQPAVVTGQPVVVVPTVVP